MRIQEEKKGCVDVVDEELGCILSIRKDDETITVWKSSIDAAEGSASIKNKKKGVWLVIRHK